MERSDSKEYYRDLVRGVKRKLASIPKSGHIRTALSICKLDAIMEKIEGDNIKDLEWAYWPPLFVFLHRHSVPEIENLEKDIDLVDRHSNRVRTSQITQFLGACPQDDRLWAAGLFETFVKARFIKKAKSAVELDCNLPNKKNTDIKLEMGGKTFHLECTVITESDEDKRVWDRFIAAKKEDAKVTLIRSGKFDSPNSKSPSPYYDCLRFYAKVYDKLAKDLNPRKTQMADNGPNVLLLSFYSPISHLSATSPGVGWALDELLADQPKSGSRVKDQHTGNIDISLLAWLEFTAKDLCRKSRLDCRKYYAELHAIVAAPRKMGGILLFDGCSLKSARINYNAHEACKVSHYEIAGLEKLLKLSPRYCR